MSWLEPRGHFIHRSRTQPQPRVLGRGSAPASLFARPWSWTRAPRIPPRAWYSRWVVGDVGLGLLIANGARRGRAGAEGPADLCEGHTGLLLTLTGWRKRPLGHTPPRGPRGGAPAPDRQTSFIFFCRLGWWWWGFHPFFFLNTHPPTSELFRAPTFLRKNHIFLTNVSASICSYQIQRLWLRIPLCIRLKNSQM